VFKPLDRFPEVLMSAKIRQMAAAEMAPAERGLAEWKKLQDHQTAIKGVETARSARTSKNSNSVVENYSIATSNPQGAGSFLDVKA